MSALALSRLVEAEVSPCEINALGQRGRLPRERVGVRRWGYPLPAALVALRRVLHARGAA